jgi:hypothetical protein
MIKSKRTKYSVVKVIRNRVLNETVASAFLDTDDATEVSDYITRAYSDYPHTSGCSCKITVSVDQGPGIDYALVQTVVINERS